MLEQKAYTKAEISEIMGVKDKQGITRKLDRLGVSYSTIGRGEACIFEITAIPDKFKTFCILELGFDSRTDFEKLAVFVYMFFSDDDFQIQPLAEMAIRMGEDNNNATRQTLSKWKKKFEENKLFMGRGEYKYYSVSHGIRREITKEKYSEAWKVYYDYIGEHSKDSGFQSDNAFTAMYVLIGGRATKRELLSGNAFKISIRDMLVDYAIEHIEQNSKTD